MRRAKEIKSIGIARVLRHNHQGVELHRAEGKIIVQAMRSWLKKQRVRIAAVLLLPIAGWGAPLTERRSAEALFTQVDGCTTVTTLVQLVQNQVARSIVYPDGWARAVWVSTEELDTCADMQRLNAAGQSNLLDGLEIDRKLASADLNTVVAVWDGVSQSPGTLFVRVHIDGQGQIQRYGLRGTSRAADAVLQLDGMGLTLRNATHDATLSISK